MNFSIQGGKRHLRGVAIVIKKEWVESIEVVKHVSDRIMWLAGVFDGEPTVIFSIHAPCLDKSTEVKDQYYSTLQDEVDLVPAKYIRKVFLGDFNARLGQDRGRVWNDVRGIFNINEVNGGLNDNDRLNSNWCGGRFDSQLAGRLSSRFDNRLS
jgi:hypothetical protein